MDHVVAGLFGDADLALPRREWSQGFGEDCLALDAVQWKLFVSAVLDDGVD